MQEGVYSEFMERLVAQTKALKVGDGIDPDNDVAPLSSKSQFDTVREYIGIGAEQGAKLALGGKALEGAEYEGGYYVEPTIFEDVPLDSRIAQEEIFGPVLTVFKAKDVQDAVRISNSVQFGLSSSIYTRDLVLPRKGGEDWLPLRPDRPPFVSTGSLRPDRSGGTWGLGGAYRRSRREPDRWRRER